MRSASTLCDHCMGIVFDGASQDAIAYTRTDLNWEAIDTFPDLPKLTSSAESGCSFCNYLKHTIKHELPKLGTEAHHAAPGSWIKVKLGKPAYAMRADIIEFGPSWEDDEYLEEPDGPYWLSLVFMAEGWKKEVRTRAWVYQGSEAVAKSLNIALRKPAQNALDTQCLDLVRSWISVCEGEHASCKSRLSSSSPADRDLPKRLIDIGGAPNSVPRLICTERAELPPSTKYVALSYCWGKPSTLNPPFITTTTNLAERQARMPIPSMPRTFQELIALVHELKLAQYIWIDALCIIQDDLADWEREAARMTVVYRNAWLTIVCAAGDNSYSGFLDRKKPAPPHAVIPFNIEGHSSTDSHFLLYPLNEYRYWDAHLPSQLHGSAWSQRAWTFQEDIMSTRVLYLGSETCYFRCQVERHLENSSIARPSQVSWNTLLSPPHEREDKSGSASLPTKNSKVPPNAEITRQATAREDALYDKWQLLITEYTVRQLTVSSDKLPALSGLANAFALALGVSHEHYLAGLWAGNLIWDLLWMVCHDAVEASRAPSWSWASWDGYIGHTRHLDKRRLRPRCTVREARATAVGLNPLGAVDAAESWIVLTECRLVRVQLRATDKELDDMMLYPTDIVARVEGGSEIVIGRGMIDGVSTSGLKKNGTFKPLDLRSLSSLYRGDEDEILALLLVHDDDTITTISTSHHAGEHGGGAGSGSSPEEEEGSETSKVYSQGLLVLSCAAAASSQVDDLQGLRTFKRIGMFQNQSKTRDILGVWESSPEYTLVLR